MDHSWRKLRQSEDSEESEELLPWTVPTGEVRSKSARSLQLLLSCLGYAVVAVLFFIFGLMFQYPRREQVLTEPSFLQQVDRSTHFNHTHVPVYVLGNNGTIWQQFPSPEVDAAWHALTSGYPFLITEADMRILGKDPDRYISVPESFGYGEKKYITRFTHTHHIHCLNHIRQRLFREYYGYANDTVDWIHTRHCLHALLDHMMCYVEYDVFHYKWIEGVAQPEPELTYNRQCRDLDAMIRFAKENRVDSDLRIFYLQPQEGDHIFPQNEELRKVEDAFFAGRPDLPSNDESLESSRKAYQDAIKYWQETGEVPTEEKEW